MLGIKMILLVKMLFSFKQYRRSTEDTVFKDEIPWIGRRYEMEKHLKKMCAEHTRNWRNIEKGIVGVCAMGYAETFGY